MAMDFDRAVLLQRAQANEAKMDGTTEPVKEILAAAEVVVGIYPDPNEPDGTGLHLIKGIRHLRGIAATGTATVKIDAILCDNLEHAVATQEALGEVDLQ